MRKKAFTLVELIIVITILAVLATIAFVSFQNYTKSARDSSRLSALTNVEKGLDIYFVQVGNLPQPENPQTFTGGANGSLSIKQGTLTKNVLQTLDKTPVDPVNGKQYTYSVFGNGKYYQVAGNLENNISKNLTQDTYANFKTTKLVGNYTYDPSLPSLVIGSGTNIFSPNTCFITNGGSNTLDSCTITKENLAGNTSDTSLVGYWDMETTFSSGGTTYLKDLSGNGNNGTGSGGLNTLDDNMISGIQGKAMTFTGTHTFIEVVDSLSLKLKNNFSISAIVNLKTISGAHILVKDTWSSGIPTGNRAFSFYIRGAPPVYTTSPYLCPAIEFHKVDRYDRFDCEKDDFIKLNSMSYLVVTYGNDYKAKMYMNGILVSEKQYNSDLRTGSANLEIGRRTKDNLSHQNNVDIDEVKIYNRVLTDEEILQQAKIAGF